jgi:DNA mismatch endonuclease (patch repair protein)
VDANPGFVIAERLKSCTIEQTVNKVRFVDTVSPEKRSEVMRRVRSKDTKPELLVRRLIHGLGYRYRLHAHKLPGRPDIIFSKRRKVIFVHGCFWHAHEGCPNYRLPKTRRDYWIPKIEGNKLRDVENIRKLGALGWDVLVIWECETKDVENLLPKITDFLGTLKS